MKNFEQILEESGVKLTEEQKKTINREMGENYKTVADWQNQHDRAENLSTQLDTAKEALKKYDGVDVAEKDRTIAGLQADLAAKEKEYLEQIAERDFNDTVKVAIAKHKGRNEKAIRALLDVDVLRQSKNQNEDLEEALKALTEAEDSKMLFGETEPDVVGTGNLIGTVRKDGGADEFAAMRAAFGLPAEKKD